MDHKSCTQDIKLVNMNVWFGLDCRGIFKFGEYEPFSMKAARFKNLANGLKSLQPDVIGIQEANPLPDYIKNLTCAIGYDAVWKATNSGIKIMGFGIPINFAAGNAILTQKTHGIRFLGSRRLSGMGLQTRYLSIHVRELRDVIAARIDIRDQSIIVFNTQIHYGVVWNNTWQQSLAAMIDNYDISPKVKEKMLKSIHKSNQRRRQEISRLIDFVKVTTQKYDYPYVIMGDFNAPIESFEMAEFVTELGLLDTYAVIHPGSDGFTWNPVKNSNTGYDASPFWANGITPRDPLNKLEAQFDRDMARRIDFIFLSHQFEPNMIKDADLVFNRPTNGIFTSDHFGLQVVLKNLPR